MTNDLYPSRPPAFKVLDTLNDLYNERTGAYPLASELMISRAFLKYAFSKDYEIDLDHWSESDSESVRTILEFDLCEKS
jgi:hypothetical protein